MQRAHGSAAHAVESATAHEFRIQRTKGLLKGALKMSMVASIGLESCDERVLADTGCVRLATKAFGSPNPWELRRPHSLLWAFPPGSWPRETCSSCSAAENSKIGSSGLGVLSTCYESWGLRSALRHRSTSAAHTETAHLGIFSAASWATWSHSKADDRMAPLRYKCSRFDRAHCGHYILYTIYI